MCWEGREAQATVTQQQWCSRAPAAGTGSSRSPGWHSPVTLPGVNHCDPLSTFHSQLQLGSLQVPFKGIDAADVKPDVPLQGPGTDPEPVSRCIGLRPHPWAGSPAGPNKPPAGPRAAPCLLHSLSYLTGRLHQRPLHPPWAHQQRAERARPPLWGHGRSVAPAARLVLWGSVQGMLTWGLPCPPQFFVCLCRDPPPPHLGNNPITSEVTPGTRTTRTNCLFTTSRRST